MDLMWLAAMMTGLGVATPVAINQVHAQDQAFRLARELRLEEARRKHFLTSAYTLREESELWKRANGNGEIAILAVGGYASRQLPFVLKQFERAGAAEQVGVIYLLELDSSVRQVCLDNMPKTFLKKVVSVDCPLFTGGMLGDRIEDAQAAEPLWGPDVKEGARVWLSRLQGESRPVLLLVLLSPGGMAALADAVVEAFHSRYEDKPIYVATILDHKSVVRKRFPQIRKLYTKDDRVRGFILTDNLQIGRAHV